MNSDQGGQNRPQEAQPDPGAPGPDAMGAMGAIGDPSGSGDASGSGGIGDTSEAFAATDAGGVGGQSVGLPPPGWYIDSNGVNRWWDGTQWGEAAQSQVGYGAGSTANPGATGYYQQPMVAMPRIAPPPPPWGTWTWEDGSPIDINTLPSYDSNKKLVAGLLGIFLGSLGVHKFILGMTTEGVITLVLSLFTCGIFAVIPLIEGIIYLTKSDEEFYWTYVVAKKKWF